MYINIIVLVLLTLLCGPDDPGMPVREVEVQILFIQERGSKTEDLMHT